MCVFVMGSVVCCYIKHDTCIVKLVNDVRVVCASFGSRSRSGVNLFCFLVCLEKRSTRLYNLGVAGNNW